MLGGSAVRRYQHEGFTECATQTNSASDVGLSACDLSVHCVQTHLMPRPKKMDDFAWCTIRM